MPDYNSMKLSTYLVLGVEVTITELQLCIIRDFVKEGITQMSLITRKILNENEILL